MFACSIIKSMSSEFIRDSIISLIFLDKDKARVLSRISIKDKVVLKNQSFLDTDMDDIDTVKKIIDTLKIIYEDYWKKLNQINTSIKLTLNVRVDTTKDLKIEKFEKTLENIDLINNFSISRFNKNFIYYKIIFNGTPDNFLKTMKDKNFNFDTQNKIWILQ